MRDMFVVIAYDCSDDKRRLRVAKILKDYGYRVQYSVFEASVDDRMLAEILRRISAVIDKEGDSVRVYRICERCLGQVRMAGKGRLTNQEKVVVV